MTGFFIPCNDIIMLCDHYDMEKNLFVKRTKVESFRKSIAISAEHHLYKEKVK